jgi:hypothetical protein
VAAALTFLRNDDRTLTIRPRVAAVLRAGRLYVPKGHGYGSDRSLTRHVDC